MATKFSQFNLEANPQNQNTQLVGLDTVAGTNIKVPADFALLDALVDAPNQVNNDMLYINNGNVDLINPSQHPNIPERIVLYAEWLNNTAGGTYFNFNKGQVTNLPFNDVQSNTSTASNGDTITMNFNGQPGAAGNTTFTIDKAGQYKVGVNWSWFDQSQQGLTVFAGIYVGGVLVKGLINEVASGFKNDINYFGQNTFTAAAGDVMEVRGEFTGGGGGNPFPSTQAGIANSICIELIS